MNLISCRGGITWKCSLCVQNCTILYRSILTISNTIRKSLTPLTATFSSNQLPESKVNDANLTTPIVILPRYLVSSWVSKRGPDTAWVLRASTSTVVTLRPPLRACGYTSLNDNELHHDSDSTLAMYQENPVFRNHWFIQFNNVRIIIEPPWMLNDQNFACLRPNLGSKDPSHIGERDRPYTWKYT